jgi:hypothetical protein
MKPGVVLDAMKRAAFVSLLLAAALSRAGADVPIRVEQLIYSLASFQGSGYSSTFALQTAETIYLLADVDNLVSVRKTLVYWWPITGEWKTDAESLNEPFAGTLEIRGPGAAKRSLSLQRATWLRTAAAPDEQWKVLTGPSADREVARAQALADAYFAAVQEYQGKSRDYDEQVQALGARILALKSQGVNVEAETARLQALRRPDAPSLPDAYQSAPEPAQDWFVVNLPPGEYAVRLVEPGGRVVEGSDRKLVVYRWRRTGGIGYEVIPGDKWTRPEESKTPASVLYVNGTTGLYLRPFHETEVNDLFYQKTVSNQAEGNPSMYRWVRAETVAHAVLEAEAPGRPPVRSGEQSFSVKQSGGSGLGYTITPYDPAASPGQPPSLVAMPLPLEPADGRLRLRLLDAQGREIPGSEREVRVVRDSPRFALYLLAALLPLLAMAAALIARARFLRGPG